MGWNEIVPREGARLLRNIGPKPYVYFAHSYYAPSSLATAATCHYGRCRSPPCSNSDNVFGVQFHPEKSGRSASRS